MEKTTAQKSSSAASKRAVQQKFIWRDIRVALARPGQEAADGKWSGALFLAPITFPTHVFQRQITHENIQIFRVGGSRLQNLVYLLKNEMLLVFIFVKIYVTSVQPGYEETTQNCLFVKSVCWTTFTTEVLMTLAWFRHGKSRICVCKQFAFLASAQAVTKFRFHP